jgi:indolepyruvate ferredoxin oxidoreductase beta subunit
VPLSALAMSPVVNVVFAGPGAAAASRALAEAAFRAGHDVKQVEVRPGLATVRFGEEVLSPLVPRGEAGFLVALGQAEGEAARPVLREGGVVIGPGDGRPEALLAALAAQLDLPEEAWEAARAAAR